MRQLPSPLRTVRLAPALLAAALGLAAGTAWSVDCEVNVLNAHNTAKARGWTFSCGATSGIIVPNFVTYPPAAIGCTFKTPPVPVPYTPGSHPVYGNFFKSEAGSRPNLKNGWKVKHFEVSGGQWSATAGNVTRVGFKTEEKYKAGHTYNFRVSKLVLTHPSGTCAKALDEAF